MCALVQWNTIWSSSRFLSFDIISIKLEGIVLPGHKLGLRKFCTVQFYPSVKSQKS